MAKKWLTTVVIGTLSLVSGAWFFQSCAAAAPPVPDDAVQKITAAMPSRATVRPRRQRKLLVFTLAKGFVHSSIPYGARALEIMGQKTGAYQATISDDPAMFAPDKIKQFDAICMVSTTGTLFDDPALKQSLLNFVAGGKGLMGIHAATDCFYDWPQYGQLIGGYFNGHPWHEEVGVKIEDPKHPVAAAFKGQNFQITDEIYQFREPYTRENLHVLLSLDMSKTAKKGGRPDNDYPVSWVKSYGKGRVFYCSLGHREEIYWNPLILRHYLDGLQFVLGDLKANTTPSGERSVDAFMGEYAGAYTPPRGAAFMIEAKVIADGGDNYRIVSIAPEAGPNSPLRRYEMPGKLENGRLVFAGKVGGEDWSGTLADGKLTAVPGVGRGKVELKKVERKSNTLGLKPPAGAVVLLPYQPGQPPTLGEWTNENWVPMPDGSVVVKGGDSRTRREFGDIRLHLEYMTPFMPEARGQGRGNSGVYLQDRYEIQVLDSFGLEPRDNEAGGIYTVAAPKVNASLPPGTWQTYDMTFRAPRLADDGKVLRPAVITILHNGVKIHDNQEIPNPTGGGAPGAVRRGPLRLQDHGNAVRYRNIWVVELHDQADRVQSATAQPATVQPAALIAPSSASNPSNPSSNVQLPGDVPIAGASSRGPSRTPKLKWTPISPHRRTTYIVNPAPVEWRSLFNGKDLTGWIAKENTINKIEDGGVLHLQPDGGDVWTKERFGDFVLDLEFKMDKGTNSGVFIRTDSIQNWLHTGIEVQVFDSYGKEKPDKHDAGAIYDVLEPSKNTVKAAGEWNRMTIAAVANRIWVRLNGQRIIDMDLNRWPEAHKNPDGTPNKFDIAYKDMKREGHIGLQEHGNHVWYRNIRLREFK